MKILVSPLNWGLGHASRCVPLVRRFIAEGHEVILGGDGESLTLLRRHFPKLRYVYLAPLTLRYSSGKRQVLAMLKSLPRLIAWSMKDHSILQAVLREEHIDQIVSDNRFGLYNQNAKCIYMTHQLHIMLPKCWKWLEGVAERLHARVYKRFDEVWIPDYEDLSLSLAGELSHPKTVHGTYRYIGPLSRFERLKEHEKESGFAVVAVLSGLEPQRSMLESELLSRFAGKEKQVLIIQGRLNKPRTQIKRGNITLVPYMNDAELVSVLSGAKHIIARSGYSTIMDLHALGLLNDSTTIELIPTPGQPEQEYLSYAQQTRNIPAAI